MLRRAACVVLLGAAAIPCSSSFATSRTENIAELQARFDQETDSLRKVKAFDKLGNAQLTEIQHNAHDGDFSTAGLTLEKYRDSARVCLAALKEQHPDAEHHPNGYRQMQMHLYRMIREVDELLVITPDGYKPPLGLVRKDLIDMNEELLKRLFPGGLEKKKPEEAAPPPKTETKP